MYPTPHYTSSLESVNIRIKEAKANSRTYGWIRFSIIVGGGLLWWFVEWPTLLWSAFYLILVVAGFLIALKKDLANKDRLALDLALKQIYENELEVLEHRFLHQATGAEYVNPEHPFTLDLDIFGRSSIFQYVNRTHSEKSSDLLAKWMMAPADAAEIAKRQAAVKELSNMHEFRERYQAINILTPLTYDTEDKIKGWLKEEPKFTKGYLWKVIRWVVPAFMLTILALYFLEYVSTVNLIRISAAASVIAFSISAGIQQYYNQINKINAEVKTLALLMKEIESAKFIDPYLQSLQANFLNKEHRASVLIKELNEILNRFDYRLNLVVFIPLNTYLLWDLQQAMYLEAWREKHKQYMKDWMSLLSTFEVLNSLGTLSFNNPDWVYPRVSEEKKFIGRFMCHPLIPPGARIFNSFVTIGEKQIAYITGSNMAGKSTFLRTVGVNLVLANMGAPVCAKEMEFYPFAIASSMRVKDNLEENTSTFYAELKKLKMIIDRVTAKEPVLVLLDEIFRGTNSNDRHIGSKALMKQLLHENAIAIVASHDLQLASLADEFPDHFTNYHFEATIKGEELHFDYQIKEGVCTSINASILMKKIGVRLEG